MNTAQPHLSWLAIAALLASAAASAQEPTAIGYAVRTPVDTTANITYASVIVPGDGTNTVDVVTLPEHGDVAYPAVISGGGQVFAYTPDPGYVGLDYFIFKVTDGSGDPSFATISVNVGNVTAVAGDDDLVVPAGTGSFLDIMFNDLGFADPVAFTITQSPAHGSLSLDIPSPAWQSLISVIYTPSPGYAGPDQFRYQLGDGIDADTAIVDLIVSPDTDADQVLDYFDNCPSTANPDQLDGDGDGVGDACDNCAALANAGQENNDGDAPGDACDEDDDNDTVPDVADNCIFVANPTQLNTDGDRFGNICDADLNNSGLTTSTDFTLMRSVLNRAASFSALAAAADMNGSGLVTTTDYTLLRSRLNTAPGPSGLP